MDTSIHKKSNTALGVVFILLTQALWVSAVFFWKLLSDVDHFTILAAQLLFSFVIAFLGTVMTGRLKEIKTVLKSRSLVLRQIAASCCIAFNWGLYIIAVLTGHIVETSISFYITPLCLILAGVVFFREKITKTAVAALILSAVGVIFLAVSYGHFPIYAILLTATFTAYSVLKKKIALSTLPGITLDMALWAPAALVWFVVSVVHPGSGVSLPAFTLVLLVLSGAVTVVPLMFYAGSCHRISLGLIGIFSYFSPTAALLIGVYVFNEPFTVWHLVAFLLIWLGVIVFLLGNYVTARKTKRDRYDFPDP